MISAASNWSGARRSTMPAAAANNSSPGAGGVDAAETRTVVAFVNSSGDAGGTGISTVVSREGAANRGAASCERPVTTGAWGSDDVSGSDGCGSTAAGPCGAWASWNCSVAMGLSIDLATVGAFSAPLVTGRPLSGRT